MENFRDIDFDEREILISGITEISKEKRSRFLWNAVEWGFLYVIILSIITGLIYQKSTDEIKRYNGIKPSFEKYEDYIMSNFFTFSYDTSAVDLSQYDPDDKVSLFIIAGTLGQTKKYSQVKEPEDYDFAGLDLREVERRIMPIHTYDLPKKTDAYKDAASRAKVLFDEEMSKRASEARKIGVKDTAVALLFVAAYIVLIIFLRKKMLESCENRLTEVRLGKCKVARATLIGRERIHRYRASTLLSIEAETEDKERVSANVKSMQYEDFESNKTCYIIKYRDEYGAYDTWDIVWEGLRYNG